MKCKKCDISVKNEFLPCWRDGDKNDILFIGEAPGHTENKSKVPFTGQSGTLLRRFVKLYNLNSSSSFTNVIKCQPPRNRNPYTYEILNCKPYLLDDINKVEPKLIVIVGLVALEVILNKNIEVMAPYINKPFIVGTVVFIPIYHPSYILRENREQSYIESFNIISDLYAKMNIYYMPKRYKKKSNDNGNNNSSS